jgi:hypothetical protein
VSAGAAPGPVERVVGETGLDRVAREIAASGDELLIASDLAGVRVGSKQVGASALATVVVARVLGMQALERPRKAGIGDPEQGVIVVSEQDVTEEGELEALANESQPLEKILPVLVAQEEEARIAGVGGEMVGACHEQARGRATRSSLGRFGRDSRHRAAPGTVSTLSWHT